MECSVTAGRLPKMERSTPIPMLVLCTGAFVGIFVWWRKERRAKTPNIPMAQGGLPLLGHALQYKEDPAGCIRWQEERVGKVFYINLAGRRMVVVGSDPEVPA